MAKKDEALCAEMPAEHLTAETDWTQLCAEAESVTADEQTAAYLEADEMDFASDAGEAPAADSSDDSSFDMLRAPLMRPCSPRAARSSLCRQPAGWACCC